MKAFTEKGFQQFVLTRFNILLWEKDKEGNKVRTKNWLEHRFSLFERYCLPSVKGQTCQEFEWIVLFDSTTPEHFKHKIEEYKKECPQLVPVFVEPEKGRLFAQIFREEVVKRLTTKRVVTTYLDNDDALNVKFVEEVQQRASSVSDWTFINYTDGYQLYTDYQYLMQIHYRRNHFMSVVESGDPETVKTIYGYGSHYYIEKIPGVKIESIRNMPMWCEVIHEKNMGNDAYFLGVRTIKEKEILRRDFGVDETVNYGTGIYLYRFLPRYVKTFMRRTKYFLFGRKW